VLRTAVLFDQSGIHKEPFLFTTYPHGNQAAFTPDGQGIVSGDPDSTLTLYNPADGQALRSYAGLDTGIRSLAFSARGKEISVYAGHSDQVIGVDFSPAGHLIATSRGNPDSTLQIWETDSGRLKSVCKHPENIAVWGPTFTPDSRQFITSEASGRKEQAIRFCDVTTGKTLRS